MSVTNDDFLDSGAAANLMGLRKATLAKLRVTGGGPVFIKAGRKVLYKKEDLVQWLDARRVKSTTEAARLPRRLTDSLLGGIEDELSRRFWRRASMPRMPRINANPDARQCSAEAGTSGVFLRLLVCLRTGRLQDHHRFR